MCGGVIFNFKWVSRDQLSLYYKKPEIDKFEKSGMAQSFFWQEKPVLPVKNDKKVELVLWGNPDEKIKLPKTGWAKRESIEDGKWNWLKPENVNIPVLKGYEKGIWFDVQPKGFKGLLIEKDGQKRVYMITKPADSAYLKLTKHNRQPVEVGE